MIMIKQRDMMIIGITVLITSILTVIGYMSLVGSDKKEQMEAQTEELKQAKAELKMIRAEKEAIKKDKGTRTMFLDRLKVELAECQDQKAQEVVQETPEEVVQETPEEVVEETPEEVVEEFEQTKKIADDWLDRYPTYTEEKDEAAERYLSWMGETEKILLRS